MIIKVRVNLMNKTIIPLKQTRKILKKSSKNLTNEELRVAIDDIETLAKLALKTYLRSKNVKLS